ASARAGSPRSRSARARPRATASPRWAGSGSDAPSADCACTPPGGTRPPPTSSPPRPRDGRRTAPHRTVPSPSVSAPAPAAPHRAAETVGERRPLDRVLAHQLARPLQQHRPLPLRDDRRELVAAVAVEIPGLDAELVRGLSERHRRAPDHDVAGLLALLVVPGGEGLEVERHVVGRLAGSLEPLDVPLLRALVAEP